MDEPHRLRSASLRDRAVSLVPAALTAWIVLPYLRLDRWVTGFDTLAYSGPNLVVSLTEIREGRLPQWNSEIFGGVTHIGNAQVAAFEPLMWIFSRLPFHRALLTIIVAHLVILATGMWWLLRRRLSLSLPAAALGTVTLIGSGLVMSRSMQFEQIAVVSWVPWVMVGVDLALDPAGSRRRLVVLPVTAALLAISGHPQQVLIAMPLVALWGAGRFLDLRPGWPGFARLAGTGVLAVGFAAAQLLPAALALETSAIVSERDISDASIPTHAVQMRRLPGTIFGDVTQTVHAFTTGGFESMGFVGAVGGALAVVGLIVAWPRRRRWTMAAMTVAAIFGAVCALGPRTPAYRFLYRVVPGFDLARVPGRWMLLFVIAAAIFAATALEAVRHNGIPLRRVLIATGVLAGVVLTTWIGPFDTPSGGAVVWWAIAFASVIGIIVAASRIEVGRAGALVVLTVAAALELGWMSDHSFARSLTQDRPFNELGGEITDALRDESGRSLALTDDRLSEPEYLVAGLRPNTNAAVGVPSLDGYDGGTQVTLRWVQTISALVDGPTDPELTLRSQVGLPVHTDLSARLGIRWLVIDTAQRPLDLFAPDWGEPVLREGATVLLQNPDWVSEARIVQHSVVAPDDSPSAKLRTAAADTVVVEDDAPDLSCRKGCDPVPVPDLVRPHHGAIDLRLPADAPAGLLVVDEQLAEGWSATVDGEAVDLVEANGLFIGVPVPAGAEDVRLRFRAPGLSTGLILSTLSLLVLLVLLLPERLTSGVVRRWRDRDEGTPTAA